MQSQHSHFKRLLNPQTQQITLPTEYPDYSKVEYWNARYTEERGITYDWYLPWKKTSGAQVGMRDIIVPRLYDDKESEILVLGCGNSELSAKLYAEEGFHYITNADYSRVIIEEMKERNAHMEEMDYVEMDITEPLDILDSESFTLILDKGCLDCVACSQDNAGKVRQMLDNVHRTLAPGGTYVCVSHGRPEMRLAQIQGTAGYKWTVEVQKVQKRPAGLEVLERVDSEQYYYIYICQKRY
ncbi:hypothetical protein FGO68_gene4145 [Halteria grandinella]|uniref:Methyltransferase domain-containing protein n=1 Tax=Halteria grandinella TaxID=5974 RepID=A0A8J8SYQ3_HALGN|nr:hypothetical protein FGO68_gene4145 [Halteria grandinella]